MLVFKLVRKEGKILVYELLTLTLFNKQADATAVASQGRGPSRVGKYNYSDHCFNCTLSSTF